MEADYDLKQSIWKDIEIGVESGGDSRSNGAAESPKYLARMPISTGAAGGGAMKVRIEADCYSKKSIWKEIGIAIEPGCDLGADGEPGRPQPFITIQIPMVTAGRGAAEVSYGKFDTWAGCHKNKFQRGEGSRTRRRRKKKVTRCRRGAGRQEAKRPQSKRSSEEPTTKKLPMAL